MSKELWIFAELNQNVIASSYYEILSKMKRVYAESAEPPCFTAVVFSDDEAVTAQLKASGADKIITVRHEKLEEYNPAYYSAALYELAEKEKPEAILIAASPVGAELAPSVSAKLDTGIVAHSADICLNEKEELVMIVPAFGGKLMGEILVPCARPVMASITPGVFEKQALAPAEHVEVCSFEAASLNDLQPGIRLLEKKAIENTDEPIETAEAVVCTGLGIGSAENFAKAKELARLLNASLCYTRPIVDVGYVDNESAMVGTSGKMIRPKLYLSFGISGAAHHVCGMKDSGLIISVNTNENADIFKISNYKIVGDSGSILDEMLKALKE